MSSKINITIGDQRLLQEAKTRGAANQQALDSRQQNAKTAADAAAAAEPEQPQRRNGVPEPKVDRRPAAQTKKKKEVVIFAGAQDLDFYIPLDSEQGAATVWNAPYTLSNAWFEKPISNTYAIDTVRIQPRLNQVFPNKTQAYQVPIPFDITFRTNDLFWTVRQYFTNLSASPTTKTGNPPTFPLDWTKLKKFIYYVSMVTSCTETTIYMSNGFRVYYAPPSFLENIDNPNVYKTPTFPAQITDTVPGAYFTRSDGQLFGTAAEYVYTDFGFYYSFDVKTKTHVVRKADITAYTESSKSFPFLTFYQNLSPLDPHADLFNSYISAYSPSVQKSFAQAYPKNRWPSSLRYNRQTGEILVLADAATGYTGSLRSLMTRTVAKNLSYTQVKQLLPVATTFPRTVLEANGFTFVKDFNISAGNSLYARVFPVVTTDG